MKKSGTTALVAFALSVGSGSAIAQQKPELLVKQRQSVMTLQLKYFGPLAAMAQGKVPYNPEIVRRNATFLDNLSRMAWDGFDPGTKGVQVQTRALPAIFDEPAKFREEASRLEQEANKLYEASRSGDESAVKAQIAAVGRVCGSCHDKFRSN